MKTFKIPISWEVYSYQEVEANSLEEALQIFDENMDDYSLPTDADYVDGSYQRESYEFCEEFNRAEGII